MTDKYYNLDNYIFQRDYEDDYIIVFEGSELDGDINAFRLACYDDTYKRLIDGMRNASKVVLDEWDSTDDAYTTVHIYDKNNESEAIIVNEIRFPKNKQELSGEELNRFVEIIEKLEKEDADWKPDEPENKNGRQYDVKSIIGSITNIPYHDFIGEINHPKEKKMTMRNEVYWKNKEENAKKAFDHYVMVGELFREETRNSIHNCRMYRFSETMEFPEPKRKYTSTHIRVIDQTTIDAIVTFKDDRNMAALNFSSYTNPGGKFLDGSTAQEESLCHNSNLYNILSSTSIVSEFYDINKKDRNKYLYTNSVLYTPNVLILKNRGDGLDKICDVNIITCAAPNVSAANRFCRDDIKEGEIWKTLQSRISSILWSAMIMRTNTLILGAYGCGVFRNDPYDVAWIFNDLLTGLFRGVFERVIFAVPSDNKKNFNAFNKVIYEMYDVKTTEDEYGKIRTDNWS